MESRIKFKIKTDYLELLMSKIMKLFRSTKNKIAKDEMVNMWLI